MLISLPLLYSTLALVSGATSTITSRASPPTMASDLRTWTQTRLSSLYLAQDDATFAAAYNLTFAPDVKMKFADRPQGSGQGEGQGVTQVTPGEGARKEQKEGEDARQALEARAKAGPLVSKSQVEFVQLEAGESAAIVSGVFTVNRTLIFRIRVALATVGETIYFNATVSGDGDGRRITEYAQTSETYRPPIVLPHLPVQPGNQGAEL